MAFDPAQDPWGVALLGTSALTGIGLLSALVARGVGRPMSLGGWMMGVGLVGFLGSAVAGAFVRLESSRDPSATSGPEAEAPGRDDAAGSPEDHEETDAKAPTDAGEPESTDRDDAGHAPEAPETEPDSNDAATNPSPGSAVAAPAALPADPAELRKAVRLILHEGKVVATNDDSCKDPRRVADVWARVLTIPEGVYRGRTKIIAKRLDACRRKIAWLTGYEVHQERMGARRDFAQVLKQRLEKEGKAAVVSLHGKDEEHVRIGSQSIDHEVFAAKLQGGLDDELAALGFELVTFSDGSEAETTRLDPVPDDGFVDRKLQPYGLNQRLRLP